MNIKVNEDKHKFWSFIKRLSKLMTTSQLIINSDECLWNGDEFINSVLNKVLDEQNKHKKLFIIKIN